MSETRKESKVEVFDFSEFDFGHPERSLIRQETNESESKTLKSLATDIYHFYLARAYTNAFPQILKATKESIAKVTFETPLTDDNNLYTNTPSDKFFQAIQTVNELKPFRLMEMASKILNDRTESDILHDLKRPEKIITSPHVSRHIPDGLQQEDQNLKMFMEEISNHLLAYQNLMHCLNETKGDHGLTAQKKVELYKRIQEGIDYLDDMMNEAINLHSDCRAMYDREYENVIKIEKNILKQHDAINKLFHQLKSLVKDSSVLKMMGELQASYGINVLSVTSHIKIEDQSIKFIDAILDSLSEHLKRSTEKDLIKKLKEKTHELVDTITLFKKSATAVCVGETSAFVIPVAMLLVKNVLSCFVVPFPVFAGMTTHVNDFADTSGSFAVTKTAGKAVRSMVSPTLRYQEEMLKDWQNSFFQTIVQEALKKHTVPKLMASLIVGFALSGVGLPHVAAFLIMSSFSITMDAVTIYKPKLDEYKQSMKKNQDDLSMVVRALLRIMIITTLPVQIETGDKRQEVALNSMSAILTELILKNPDITHEEIADTVKFFSGNLDLDAMTLDEDREKIYSILKLKKSEKTEVDNLFVIYRQAQKLLIFPPDIKRIVVSDPRVKKEGEMYVFEDKEMGGLVVSWMGEKDDVIKIPLVKPEEDSVMRLLHCKKNINDGEKSCERNAKNARSFDKFVRQLRGAQSKDTIKEKAFQKLLILVEKMVLSSSSSGFFQPTLSFSDLFKEINQEMEAVNHKIKKQSQVPPKSYRRRS